MGKQSDLKIYCGKIKRLLLEDGEARRTVVEAAVTMPVEEKHSVITNNNHNKRESSDITPLP